MKPKFLNRLIYTVAILLSITIIAFALMFAFIMTGPRSLNIFLPYIESSLNPAGSAYQLKVEDTLLIFDGWKHPIAIHAKNVDVFNQQKVMISHLPEVAIQFKLLPLFIGRVVIQALEIYRPNITWVQDEKGKLALDSSAVSTVSAPSNISLTSLLDGELMGHLESLVIKHANVAIKKDSTDMAIQSVDAEFEIRKKKGNVQGKLLLPLIYEHQNGEVNVIFMINKQEQNITADITSKNLPSSLLKEVLPGKSWSNAIHVPVSGTAHIVAGLDTTIRNFDFDMNTGVGTLDYQQEFEKPLEIETLKLSGSASNNLTSLIIKESNLIFKNVSLNFHGKLYKQNNDIGVDGSVETLNLPIDSIKYYWPHSLASHSREWVINHISKGMITKGTANLHFKPGDFKLEKTPKEAVDTTIEVKNASMRYMPTHPIVNDITGLIHFTGDTMDAKLSHASFLTDTHLTRGTADFPDLYAHDVRLYLDYDMDAAAKDVVEFLSLPDLNKANILQLDSSITGRIKGNTKLDFVAFSDDDNKNKSAESGQINYHIKANLINVSQTRFMGNRDVQDANMDLSLDNKDLETKGHVIINTVPMDIKVSSKFNREEETSTNIKCIMPVNKLTSFGLPSFSPAKGDVGVDADLFSSIKQDKANVKLDLTRVSYAIPEIELVKKINDPSSLKLTTEKLPSGNTLIKDYTLSGANINIKGSAEIDKKGDIQRLNAAPLYAAKNNLDQLNYSKKSNDISLSASGKSLDASYFTQASGTRKSLNYTVDIKTDNLILTDKHEMQHVGLQATCKPTCQSVHFDVTLQDKTVCSYNIINGALNSECNNGGELVKSLGLFDGIQGGKMTMTGNIENNVLKGQMVMTDYHLTNAPILTKIFTIASLTGLFDTITGQGIHFKKMTAPFSYADGTIVLKDAKAYGSALGITSEGSINLLESTLDLKGTLVPSYTINSLVGNIPLIGDLLMGGSGKGLIAINYSVSGKTSDPSISVNPLSVFTPGFLRGIFDIFDEPAPDLDKIEKDKKSAVTPQS